MKYVVKFTNYAKLFSCRLDSVGTSIGTVMDAITPLSQERSNESNGGNLAPKRLKLSEDLNESPSCIE